MQQKCSNFRSCRYLLFSLLPRKTHSSCVSFKYLFFFFVGFTGSCVSWVILSAVHTSCFLQGIFLHMVWVHFTAFGRCVSSCTGFSVVSILLAFEAPQWSQDILFDPLYTIAYLHFFGNVGLVECQDVGVGFYFSSPFLMIILFMFVNPPPVFLGLPTSLLLPTPTPYS